MMGSAPVSGKNFSLALVSRRSKERAGCRLFTRGIDSAGHVANFVETEQIVEASFERASFVQVRAGSNLPLPIRHLVSHL